MIDPARRVPALIFARDAAPMPRWVLPALVLAFLLPGQFGHDPWPQDATAFVRAAVAAHGGPADWLLPHVAGVLVLEGGPLPAWIGALFIRLAGPWLGETHAAALPNLLWLPCALLLLWQAVATLGQRPQAQPLAGAFGGEPSPTDYARLLANTAVLLVVGTLGIIWRLHQAAGDSLCLALVAAVLWAMAAGERRPRLTLAVLAGACAGLSLTSGLAAALALLLAGWAAGPWRATAGRGVAVLVAVLAALPWLAWLAAAWRIDPATVAALLEHPWGLAGLAGPSGLGSLLRNGAWFLWPLWPLAAWGVVAWRSTMGQAHVLQALATTVALALAGACTGAPEEGALVPLVMPLAALAALGACTLRRALDNLIDWLAIVLFTLALGLAWAYFAALVNGSPKAMAGSMARLVPGFQAHAPLAVVVPALAASVAWVQLVLWRVVQRPRVLWRGPLLAAGGVASLWVVVSLLFLPAIDHAFSQRAFALEIAGVLRANASQGCVAPIHIPLAERALLAYHGGIAFAPEEQSGQCSLALQRLPRRSLAPEGAGMPGGLWRVVWEGQRLAGPQEHWRVLERLAPGPSAP
jgi:4-amino-4-deoxy-L-arabinose transferase-like glycosyltransferase